MTILIAWFLLCASYLLARQDATLVSSISEIILVSVSGFFVYGLGWVYMIFWGVFPRQSLLFNLYKYVWWPISPLFFIFSGELEEVGRFSIFVFCCLVIFFSFVLKDNNYIIFNKVVSQNERDAELLSSLESRADLWWFDILYWGLVFFAHFYH